MTGSRYYPRTTSASTCLASTCLSLGSTDGCTTSPSFSWRVVGGWMVDVMSWEPKGTPQCHPHQRNKALLRCHGAFLWSNYSDLTRPKTPNRGLVREIPLFQGNLGWWNIIWPDFCTFWTGSIGSIIIQNSIKHGLTAGWLPANDIYIYITYVFLCFFVFIDLFV